MSYWRSHQGGGILLIMVATLSFAIPDTATRHIMQLAPVLMLLWFRYPFQVVTMFGLRFPVQRTGLFTAGMAAIAASGIGNALVSIREAAGKRQ